MSSIKRNRVWAAFYISLSFFLASTFNHCSKKSVDFEKGVATKASITEIAILGEIDPIAQQELVEELANEQLAEESAPAPAPEEFIPNESELVASEPISEPAPTEQVSEPAPAPVTEPAPEVIENPEAVATETYDQYQKQCADIYKGIYGQEPKVSSWDGIGKIVENQSFEGEYILNAGSVTFRNISSSLFLNSTSVEEISDIQGNVCLVATGAIKTIKNVSGVVIIIKGNSGKGSVDLIQNSGSVYLKNMNASEIRDLKAGSKIHTFSSTVKASDSGVQIVNWD